MHHFIGNRNGCNETCIKITLFYAEEFQFLWNKKKCNETCIKIAPIYAGEFMKKILNHLGCVKKFDSYNQKQPNTKSDPKR